MVPGIRMALRCFSVKKAVFTRSQSCWNSQNTWLLSRTLICKPTSQFGLVQSRFVTASAVGDTATGDLRPKQNDNDSVDDDEVVAEDVRRPGLRFPEFCSGCGVKLQQTQPDSPGYFQPPRRLIEQQLQQQDQGKQQRPSQPPPAEVAEPSGSEDALEVLCGRCFSLRNYGRIQSGKAEALLPAFDLGKKVGRKIALQTDRRAVVLCVVDITDFDGSLPRLALRALLPPGTGAELPQDLKFKLMIAINKFDLLPSQVTPMRTEQWVRSRMRSAGLPRPDRVFVVSAATGSGVAPMAEDLRSALGLRADLWVVGAQNAGKSSLISAMKKLAGTAGKGDPTVAPIPGTTLGLLKVPGLPLGPKHRAFDTPGVPHDYQLTARLKPDELKHVLPRRRLKPRTYRLGPGQSVLVGGLARLDVVRSPGATLYLTVFVSDDITLHMGKTEGATERWSTFAGTKLLPPHTSDRFQALGPMVPRDVLVEGKDWQISSTDISIAGLGWVGVGLSGQGMIKVWVPKEVAVTTRAALVPDFAKEFEHPGFSAALPNPTKPAAKKSKERKPMPDIAME